MSETSVSGRWPETSIEDVYNAWKKLGGVSLKNSKVVLIGPKHLINNLDAQYEKTTWTYASIIKQNLLLDGIIRLRSDNSIVLLCTYKINTDNYPEISFHNTCVKILGVNRVNS